MQRQATTETQQGTKATPVMSGIMQRKCACGDTPGMDGECAECRQTRLGLRRKAVHRGEPITAVPSIVNEVVRSPGQPLDGRTRAFMEPRFGHDFSQVRVHTDGKAAASARVVSARAYTVGHHIALAAGSHAIAGAAGRQLLAHELVHVLQADAGSPMQGMTSEAPAGQLPTGNAIAAREATSERQADRMAARAAAGLPAIETPLAAGGLQKAPDDGEGEGPQGDESYNEDINISDTEDDSTSEEAAGSSTAPVIYMCSKALDTSPLGSHALFRIGGSGKGNPTISLQPIDASLGANCWQGVPDRDYPSDKNADAVCERTSITLACLEREFRAYPIGHYCTLGPNSNTFVGHVARNCGISNPDPPGWTPGIDDSPPPSGTFAPDKWATLTGCKTKICIIDPETPPGTVGV